MDTIEIKKKLVLLSAVPEVLMWQDRREIVHAIVELQQSEEKSLISNALMLLAGDAKWEVRKAVADAILLLDDFHIPPVAALLLNDSNAFVKQSAQRSMARRQNSKVSKDIINDSLTFYADQLNQFENRYGPSATKALMRIIEERHSILTGAMSHDLLSILTSLNWHAINLNGEFEENKHVLGLIDDLEFLELTLNDIATFSTQVSEDREMELVIDVCNRALNLAQQNLKKIGFSTDKVAVNIAVPSDLQFLVAREPMVLAFTHIIKNGYESFMENKESLREGAIAISAAIVNNQLIVSFKDNGMGISEENLKKLREFIPRRANKDKKKSTGYGLPLTNMRVKAHQGKIEIESVIDVGTTVSILLPSSGETNAEYSNS